MRRGAERISFDLPEPLFVLCIVNYLPFLHTTKRYTNNTDITKSIIKKPGFLCIITYPFPCSNKLTFILTS